MFLYEKKENARVGISSLLALVRQRGVDDLQDPVLAVVAVDGGEAQVGRVAVQPDGQQAVVAVAEPGDLRRKAPNLV